MCCGQDSGSPAITEARIFGFPTPADAKCRDVDRWDVTSLSDVAPDPS